jgi:hypothetical protein
MTSVVPNRLNEKSEFSMLGERKGHSVIKSIQDCELINVGLYEISKLVHQSASGVAAHLPPGSVVESFSGSSDGLINITLTSIGDLGNHGLCCGVDSVEGLSALGINELAVDE